MDRYEDYKRGMRLLKEEAARVGLYGRLSSYKWISHLSWVLSGFGVCEQFWYNTCIQNKIPRIENCHVLYDLFWGDDTYLFSWNYTEEDFEFWHNIALAICNKYGDQKELIALPVENNIEEKLII